MNHVLTLTDEQLGVVGTALAELPFRVAQPVLAAIQQQIDASAAKAAAEAAQDEQQAAA